MPATLIDFTQLSKLWKIGVATLLTLMSTGGIVTLYQGQNASGVVTHKLLSDGSIEQSGSLLIHSGSTTFYADSINKRVGVRTRTPETTLEVAGTASGRVFHAQDELHSSGSLVVEGSVTLAGVPSCTALQTSSAGALSCNNNVYLTTSTGSLRTSFDSRYVNTSGDTMTGALSIKKTSGTGTGNTLVVDTNGLVYDATNKRLGIGTAAPSGYKLDIDTSAANGALRLFTTLSNQDFKMDTAGTDVNFYAGAFGRILSSGDFHLGANNAVGLSIIGGNVGINNQLPGSRLAVTGSGTFTGALYSDSIKISTGAVVTTVCPAAIANAATSNCNYVTDGTADNSEIQSAINYNRSQYGGGVIHLKCGVYDIASTVDIKDGIIFEGEGRCTQLNLAAGAWMRVQTQHDVVIRNLATNGVNQNANTDFSFFIDSSSGVVLNQVNVLKANGFGIFLRASPGHIARGYWVTDSFVEGLGNNDAIGGGPVDLVSGAVRDIFIANNYVIQPKKPSGGTTSPGAIVIVKADGYQYLGNTIYGSMVAGGEASPNMDSIIQGNILRVSSGSTESYMSVEGAAVTLLSR